MVGYLRIIKLYQEFVAIYYPELNQPDMSYYKSFCIWKGSYLFVANALLIHKEENDS